MPPVGDWGLSSGQRDLRFFVFFFFHSSFCESSSLLVREPGFFFLSEGEQRVLRMSQFRLSQNQERSLGEDDEDGKLPIWVMQSGCLVSTSWCPIDPEFGVL